MSPHEPERTHRRRRRRHRDLRPDRQRPGAQAARARGRVGGPREAHPPRPHEGGIHQQRGLPGPAAPCTPGGTGTIPPRALRAEPQGSSALRPGRVPRPLPDRTHTRGRHRRHGMKRPPSVLYGVDERMPKGVLFLSGLQHVGLMAMFLLYPVLIAKAVGAPAEVAASLVSLTLIAMAVGTILQVIPIGPFGSGYLCQPIPSIVYLVPSLL